MVLQQLAYWVSQAAGLPYIKRGELQADFIPAFRHGVLSSLKYTKRTFSQVEIELARAWFCVCDGSHLQWQSVRPAVLDAWTRMRECADPKGPQRPFSQR